MGQSKKKRAKFLVEHPVCCFCGGDEVATTIDHVPPRAAFYGRAGPEGFEFPACQKCQIATRLDEIAFAFLAFAIDHNQNNFDPAVIDRLTTGMVNNLPHLVPRPIPGAIEKRKIYRAMGQPVPLGRASQSWPIVSFDPQLHDHILRYIRKIACALFYRENGRVLPPDFLICAIWKQFSDVSGHETLEGWLNMTPILVQGKRTNLDFGDRFAYRVNKVDRPDISALVAVGLLGKGLLFYTAIIDPKHREKMEVQDWVATKDIFT